MGNWFAKEEYVGVHVDLLPDRGRRGLVMGIWNSCNPVGNIVGSVVSGALLTYGWSSITQSLMLFHLA
jgi:MFS family permease